MPRKKSKRPTLTPGWALYLRTSDEEAQAPERSQASQRRLIRERVMAGSDLPLITEYADTYSGRSTDRQQYRQLLADAKLGKFSHVGIAFVDRFGRNDVEGIRAFDELIALGITVRVATHPSLDPSTSDGRMIIGISFTVARFESDRISERSREGMLTKLLQGGWTWRAPDGYRNCEAKSNLGDLADKLNNARYKRWIELDPEQSKIWRLAWDLLLEDRLSLNQICEQLHAKGYRLKSGTPFVRITKAGKRKANAGALSRAFRNWFYAGWVVLDADWGHIPPKTVRGHWPPIVTTEEFEAGLLILERRRQHQPYRRIHFYLLQGLVYLENEDGKALKLTCSMPNANRKRGGVAYYCIPSSNLNFLCWKVDEQIQSHLQAISVERRHMAGIRRAFTADLEERLADSPDRERGVLESVLQTINEEEARAARLYAAGKISDEVWSTLWKEWRERRATVKSTLESLDKNRAVYLANLDAALKLIAKIGILYERLDPPTQREVLRNVVKRVIINTQGKIVRMELRPPFTYLCGLAPDGADTITPDAGGPGDACDEKQKTDSPVTTSSLGISFGTPKGTTPVS